MAPHPRQAADRLDSIGGCRTACGLVSNLSQAASASASLETVGLSVVRECSILQSTLHLDGRAPAQPRAPASDRAISLLTHEGACDRRQFGAPRWLDRSPLLGSESATRSINTSTCPRYLDRPDLTTLCRSNQLLSPSASVEARSRRAVPSCPRAQPVVPPLRRDGPPEDSLSWRLAHKPLLGGPRHRRSVRLDQCTIWRSACRQR